MVVVEEGGAADFMGKVVRPWVFFFFFLNDRNSEEKNTETVGHVDEGTAKV